MLPEDKKEFKVGSTYYATGVFGLSGGERVLDCVAAVLPFL